MPYWELFEGKTHFNKLWFSFDKRAELDLRLTKYLTICRFILLFRGSFFGTPRNDIDENGSSNGNSKILKDAWWHNGMSSESPWFKPQ